VAKKKAKKPIRKKTKKAEINKLLNKRLRKLKQKPSKTRYLFIFILALVIIAAITYFLYTTYNKEPVVCTDLGCFLEQAANCEPAIYTTKIATATIELKIKPGCKLIKKILGLDSDEAAEIRAFFTGKEMTCSYDKGAFNPVLAKQISGPLDDCTGNLVDAIKAVV